jgi:hypothetical protein
MSSCLYSSFQLGVDLDLDLDFLKVRSILD